jgi:hypothetical protein
LALELDIDSDETRHSGKRAPEGACFFAGIGAFLFRAAGSREAKGLTLLWVLAVLTGCAAHPSLVDHAFGFDLRKDGQAAEILAYQYGESALARRAAENRLGRGDGLVFDGLHGPMKRGDFLYVKWRDTASGQIHETRVDLRPRLPPDITDHTVYLMIRGAQLQVYLVSPPTVARAANVPTEGPQLYHDRNIARIYP